MVESHSVLHDNMVAAVGSLTSMKWFDKEKKPGSELVKTSANSAVIIH